MSTNILRRTYFCGTFLLFASIQAFADAYQPHNVDSGDLLSGIYSITIEQTGTVPAIRVQSDGKKYTGVKPEQSITWQARTRGVCRVKRKIREYRWWLNDNSQVSANSYYTHHKKLTQKNWITSKSKNDKYAAQGQLSLPVSGKLANAAVQACNSYLNAELGKGKTLQSVLSQDKTLSPLDNQNPALAGVVYMQCSEDAGMDTMLGHAWQNVRINTICEGFDFPKPARSNVVAGKLAASFTLEPPKVTVTPDKYSGQCPVDLTVKGTLKGSQGQKKVQYRWSHNGALGPVASTSLNSSGWRSVSTLLKDIGKAAGNPGNTLAAPQREAGNKNLQAKGQVGNMNSGFVQLLALEEGSNNWSKARVSAKAFYQASCKEPIHAVKAKISLPSPKPAPQSDLTPGDTLTVSNMSGTWGSKLLVDASQSSGRKRGNSCELRMAYDVKNIGQGDASQSSSRLFEQAQSLHQGMQPSLSAGTAGKISGVIYLSDGSHLVGVSVDDQQQVDESNESNNKQRITVEVRGCGSTPRGSTQTAPPPRR